MRYGNQLPLGAMARLPRLDLPGVPIHVILRGNNRAACFFGDIDRRFYLKCLRQASARRHCAIHAYVLMSNHVHLLVTPNERGSLAAMLQDLGRRYVRVINAIHGRTGTLWEGRYKSCLVDSENYLLTCHRYIEMNPVRAGLEKCASAYAWSSHVHYAFGKPDALITPHPVFMRLGNDVPERRAAFRSLFDEQLDESTLERIRYAANTCSALGSESFLKETEALVGRVVRPPKRGRPVRTPNAEADSLPISGKLF